MNEDRDTFAREVTRRARVVEMDVRDDDRREVAHGDTVGSQFCPEGIECHCAAALDEQRSLAATDKKGRRRARDIEIPSVEHVHGEPRRGGRVRFTLVWEWHGCKVARSASDYEKSRRRICQDAPALRPLSPRFARRVPRPARTAVRSVSLVKPGRPSVERHRLSRRRWRGINADDLEIRARLAAARDGCRDLQPLHMGHAESRKVD